VTSISLQAGQLKRIALKLNSFWTSYRWASARVAMMDTFITDKVRGLVLWKRLRVSYYVNTIVILVLVTSALSQQPKTVDGSVAALFLIGLIVSHLNYHYHLAKVATFIGKNSNWWFASFVTFPFGPLLSYHFIKPAAIRSGIPL